MSDYALKLVPLTERIAKMLGGTTYRDLREGFTTLHMDALRGKGEMIALSYARRKLRDRTTPDPLDLGPEILAQYVSGHLTDYEKIAAAYMATQNRYRHAFANEMRKFACFVAQGILIGHPLNIERINLLCRMAGVNADRFAIDVSDALRWLYGEAESAAGRYVKAVVREPESAT